MTAMYSINNIKLMPVKKISVLISFLVIAFWCNSQSGEVNLLDDINPQHPNSFLWKGVSNTTYPISFGLPAGMFIASKINKNKAAEKKSIELAGSVVIAAASAQVFKLVVNRQRPYEKYTFIHPYEIENDNSFPSSHTSVAFAAATTLSIQYKKWYVTVPAYVWAAGVGYSRLYLGEHYPTDVLAGAVLGAGSAVVSHVISKKIFK